MGYKTINGTTSNQTIESKIECEYSSVVATNASTVTAKLYYRRTNTGYITSGTGSFSITINGTTQSRSGVKLEISNAWVLAMSATVTVPHNPDGTKTITVSATGSLPPSSLTSTNCSGSVTLDNIPRASTIQSAADTVLGEYYNVRWTPLSASFRYKLKFSIGSYNGWSSIIYPGSTAPYTYRAISQMDVAKQFKTRTGKMQVTLYTYSDSNATTQVGKEDTEEFTVTVPKTDDTKPTVGMALAPASGLSTPFDSLYLQGKSKVQATLDISTKYGADIKTSNITVEGTTYGYPYESGTLSQVGTQTIRGYVVDSREYDGICDREITVIPYSKPKLQAASGENNIVAARCDQNGKLSDSGTYLKIKAKISYEKVIANDVQNNFGKIQYRHRVAGSVYSSWQTILDTKTSASDEVVTGALLNGALSVKSNYQVQIRAIDSIEESEPVTLSVPSEKVYMHRPAGGESMGLGGYSSGAGNLDVYWKIKARNGLYLVDEDGIEISVEEKLPQDYIVEQGITDGWTWRKWSSGIAECWAIATHTPTSASGMFGFTVSLPFSFTSTDYIVQLTKRRNGVLVTFVEQCNTAGNVTNTTTSFPLTYGYEHADIYAVDFNIYVVGKWK